MEWRQILYLYKREGLTIYVALIRKQFRKFMDAVVLQRTNAS